MFERIFVKKRFERGRELDPEEIFMDSINLPGHDRLAHEGRLEKPLERRTFSVLAFFITAGLIVIASRLFELQYIRGGSYLAASQKNISYTLFTAPPRGVIYDRNMKVLASNTASFALVLKKNEVKVKDDFAVAIKKGAALAGLAPADIFLLNSRGQDLNKPLPENLFAPEIWPDDIVFIDDIPHELLLRVATNPNDFKGFVIEEAIRRVYDGGPAFGQVVGFTGHPTQDDWMRSAFYRSGNRIIGKSGIEFMYENKLQGSPGRKVVEIDSNGRAQRERFIDKPVFGDHVVLNIDAAIQSDAYDAMARHIISLHKKAGAIVVSDPRDGRIIALVSYPSFDPQVFADGKDFNAIRAVLADKRQPLFNRAIAGVYAPGSTVKPVMATAALEEKVIDPTYQIYDEGFISVPNPYDPTKQSIFKDWSKLGWVDMRRAIAYSANVYFYTVGGGYGPIKGLGIDRIRKFFSRFGFGSPLGIDLAGEKGGLIPGPEEKKKTRPEDPFWRVGDTYITSIGQGDTGATPLQLNFTTVAIANGGTLWRPFVTRSVLDDSGAVVDEVKPQVIRDHLADPKSLEIVREGMRMAVTEGSAKVLGDFPIKIGGKTGTAQTGVVGKNQGWFTGFAPYDNPEIAVTVLVEEGTGGSTDAVPIAKEIFYSWLAHRSAVSSAGAGLSGGTGDKQN